VKIPLHGMPSELTIDVLFVGFRAVSLLQMFLLSSGYSLVLYTLE
jgi:hypothetical protein